MRRAALSLSFVLLFAARAEAADPPSSLPSPPLVLTVTPGTAGGPWTMRVENTGDVPVRIAAEPRLLALELSAASGDAKTGGKARPLRCALPEDARPSTDEGKELVVPGKRSWSAKFDPVFYCFGARERAALAAGTAIVAHFGWAPPSKNRAEGPPFVAAPVGAAIGKVASVKELTSAPFTLSEGLAQQPTTDSSSAGKDGDDKETSLSLSVPESFDVLRGVDVTTTITITNSGDRKAILLFRPATIGLSVSGPQGSVRCGATPRIASPIPELFTTLPPKGRSQITVLVGAMCPADTFDEAGVYRITPRLDTTNASGRALGLKTFDGEVVGRTPMLLRVRNPRRHAASARPKLD